MQLDQYLESSKAFLNEVADELIMSGQQDKVVRVLKAVFVAFRERLLVHESFDVLAELPPLIKVFYIEGWKPGKEVEGVKTIQAFLARVKDADPTGEADFSTETEIIDAVNAIFRVLKRHLSRGEKIDVAAGLPKDLKKVWDAA
ncbi:MAG: DUF2267 domain-containing protein [Bdellovibrionota bacterium]